ncbi:hypothetical protein [Microbacterium sp. NPDC057650]|uniref:hypothetical protein n=1 Tax=unclassified Microbacterium TaxID=2609290 RepID=UPI0036735F23
MSRLAPPQMDSAALGSPSRAFSIRAEQRRMENAAADAGSDANSFRTQIGVIA